jgi:ankyrin repeat protein
MCAARNNRSEVVDFLLDTLEDLKMDAVDLEKQTALYHAALGGHAGIVRRLVEAGAKTDARNKVQLHTVALFRDSIGVRMFLIMLDILDVVFVLWLGNVVSHFEGRS